MNNVDSKAFKIKNLFEISTGANIPNYKLKSGKIPRISAKALNNGIQQYTDFIEEPTFRTNSNFISISFLGDSFYHPYFASVDMKIHILKLKELELNRYIGLYLTTALNHQMKKYNYGNQLSLATLKKECILLPINSENKPDWEYMEKITKNLEQKQITKYVDYLNLLRSNSTMGGADYNLNSRMWKEFYIHDIFDKIQRGKRLTKSRFINGKTPYISSTAFNNGVDSFIGNTEKVRMFENCLTLANSGSVGSTFYHPYTFVASDHVTHLKNEKFDKYVYLFMASIVKQLGEKYNFNREINDERLKREFIILPVNENNEPDYEYMRQYMINQEIELLNKYKKYIEKRLFSNYISEKERLR